MNHITTRAYFIPTYQILFFTKINFCSSFKSKFIYFFICYIKFS